MPTSDPDLGDVSFKKTAKYHWEQVNLNITDPNTGKLITSGFTVVDGLPPLFKKAVEVKKENKECLMDNDFGDDDDDCFGNPAGCPDGFTFSFFYHTTYLEDHLSFLDPDITHDREFIAGSGGDETNIGFSIFREGGTLGAIVNDGNQYWWTAVEFFTPLKGVWCNLGIRWSYPTNGTLEDGESAETGLDFFFNKEVIGSEKYGKPCPGGCFQEYSIPPRMTVGCLMTPSDNIPNYYASGIVDEVAFWPRRLPRKEEPYLLGGHEDMFANRPPEQIVYMFKFTDLTDPNQMKTVVNFLQEIINGGGSSDEDIDTSETTTQATEDTTTKSGGSGGDSTTAKSTTTEDPEVQAEKEQEQKLLKALNDILFVTDKLTDVEALGPEVKIQDFPIRLQAAIPVAEVLSMKGKYVPNWQLMNEDPNRKSAHESLEKLSVYLLTIVERRQEIRPNSMDRLDVAEFSDGLAGSNFGAEVFKMRVEDYKKLGTKATSSDDEDQNSDDNEEGYWNFPDWKSSVWQSAIEGFGEHPGSFDPTEKVKIPVDVFDKSGMSVSFVGLIIDTFPDGGRKNPATVRANKIQLDSRVIVIKITANVQTADPNDVNNRTFSPCGAKPQQSQLFTTPLKLEFGVKSFRHNFGHGRKLQSYFDSLDQSIVRKRHCAIWNEGISTNGAWDTEGVKTVYINDATAECSSTKFGTFGIIAEIEDLPYAPDDELWLVITKYTGYTFSLLLLTVFICMVLFSQHLWEMFQVFGLNSGFALLMGHILMIVTDLDSIRDNRINCTAIGTLMAFFYVASAVVMLVESAALFQAVITGAIGGRSKSYLLFGWGASVCVIGNMVYNALPYMGIDARCMIAYKDVSESMEDPKWLFFAPLLAAKLISMFICLITLCNIRTAAMRKEVFVEELKGLASGIFCFELLFSFTWFMAPFAYMKWPDMEIPDFYPAFQVLNSFTGIFFFIFIGVFSKRFRTGLVQIYRRK